MKLINFGFRHGQNCTGEEVVHIAIQAISNAVTAEQLRYVQAEIFSLRFALSLEQTAEVTGLSIGWASKQLTNSFTERPHAIAPSQRVGRRRQNFTLEEEAAALKPFLEQVREGGDIVVGQIKHHLDDAL